MLITNIPAGSCSPYIYEIQYSRHFQIILKHDPGVDSNHIGLLVFYEVLTFKFQAILTYVLVEAGPYEWERFFIACLTSGTNEYSSFVLYCSSYWSSYVT